MGIHKLLKERFGFDQFRTGQEDVIRDVIAGKDTIAILPTGIGKVALLPITCLCT